MWPAQVTRLAHEMQHANLVLCGSGEPHRQVARGFSRGLELYVKHAFGIPIADTDILEQYLCT